MTMIPMFRPPALSKEMALQLISDAIDRGYIGEGPLCRELELELTKFLQVPAALFMNSCTSALRLAFHLAGARHGTEVVCTPMTCLATATAILETGASVVWADIDLETGNIDPESVARMVGPKTVAVAAVDWGGRRCDFSRLRYWINGITLVEDAAHAFGAGAPSGYGDFVCYSGQAIKHWTSADGGVLVCPGSALTERARLLRWFGLDRSRGASMRCMQNVPEAGFKMQGNDILASVGLASLVGVQDRIDTHRSYARRYHGALADASNIKVSRFDETSSFWFFPIQVSSPLRFMRWMGERGVEVGQVHARLDTMACFDGVRSDRLDGLEAFASHQVNLPCGSHLTSDQVDEVIRLTCDWNDLPAARW
jgi:dTDP-4-amino-4,6-dideoxygalactose transaminase